MGHSFQALASLIRPERSSLLLAACGSNIYTLDAESLLVISKWTPGNTELKPAGESFVLLLRVSQDGRHVIAATSEDKAVLTFSIRDSGELELLTRRRMLKRPCALAMDTDGMHILCGDKFGDVYCLPIVEPQTQALNESNRGPPKLFRPSANEFTVHTERNRKALKNQIESPARAQKELDSLDFQHELLLGHVSMLTDVACQSARLANGLKRPCIITADRDEHIRVTRARPQTHVIHSFCFGHKSFVSKLCFPTANVLVSGGGDEELYVWDWYGGRLIGKLNLLAAVQALPSHASATEVVVSGLWSLPSKRERMNIICICEGISGVFVAGVDIPDEVKVLESSQIKAIPLAANPLDAAVFDEHVVLSVDNTTPHVTSPHTDEAIALESFKILLSVDGDLSITRMSQHSDSLISSLKEQDSIEEQSLERLREAIYPYGRLRKRPGQED